MQKPWVNFGFWTRTVRDVLAIYYSITDTYLVSTKSMSESVANRDLLNRPIEGAQATSEVAFSIKVAVTHHLNPAASNAIAEMLETYSEDFKCQQIKQRVMIVS